MQAVRTEERGHAEGKDSHTSGLHYFLGRSTGKRHCMEENDKVRCIHVQRQEGKQARGRSCA
jgi:hypothetical protein